MISAKEGGNLVDFGIAYHNCSVKELLTKFDKPSSFQQHNIQAVKDDDEVKKIKVLTEKKILLSCLSGIWTIEEL